MKKLLGIVVLGLLWCNVGNADVKKKIDLSFCRISDRNIFALLTEKLLENCLEVYASGVVVANGKKITYQEFLQKAYWVRNICFKPENNHVMSKRSPCVEDFGQLKIYYENGSFYYIGTETQIVKKEPDFYLCKRLVGGLAISKSKCISKGKKGDYKEISLREYVDIRLNSYLNSSSYNSLTEGGYINLVIRPIKSELTKHNFATHYLDSQIIKFYSDKVDKKKILKALKIEKEPTEKQILASINISSKDEFEQIIKKEKKEKEEKKLRDAELKKQREEVQRLVEADEKRQKDPVYRAESELGITIKKATQETDAIKINEEYALNCESEIEDYRLIFNQKVIKSKILKSEMIMNFEGEEIYFKIDSKINSKGKLSGTKLKVHYSPDFDKDIKNSIKPFMDMFKEIAVEGFTQFSLYGKTLAPIKIEDKKKSKKFLSLLKKMLANKPEMKKELKKLKVKVYDHYLGTAEIQSEKFYILTTFMTAEHPNEDFSIPLEEMSNQTQYSFIHIASGYVLQFDEEMPSICTIYKQDKELIKLDSTELFN